MSRLLNHLNYRNLQYFINREGVLPDYFVNLDLVIAKDRQITFYNETFFGIPNDQHALVHVHFWSKNTTLP